MHLLVPWLPVALASRGIVVSGGPQKLLASDNCCFVSGSVCSCAGWLPGTEAGSIKRNFVKLRETSRPMGVKKGTSARKTHGPRLQVPRLRQRTGRRVFKAALAAGEGSEIHSSRNSEVCGGTGVAGGWIKWCARIAPAPRHQRCRTGVAQSAARPSMGPFSRLLFPGRRSGWGRG